MINIKKINKDFDCDSNLKFRGLFIITSLEYVLKRFTDDEKELLCQIKCMPYLQ
jgi:hypothetical protein